MPEVNEVLEPAQLNLIEHTVQAAYNILPAKFSSPEATNLLLAIGWQESRFEHRAQIGGPARGFWQFERGGGVHGVLEHKATKVPIREVLLALKYPANMDSATCWHAIEHNDVLAFCFARLLLYTLPPDLPSLEDSQNGWKQYIAAWRPGKPHPHTWLHAWDWASYVYSTF